MTIADQVKSVIESNDRLIDKFGMVVEHIEAGKAAVSMRVAPDHLNAAGLCHGAAMYALADVAFALACNSHGTMALALEVSINYLKPVKKGERVTATAEEVHLGKRTGLYSIRVVNGSGQLVAYLKATAFRFEGSLVH